MKHSLNCWKVLVACQIFVLLCGCSFVNANALTQWNVLGGTSGARTYSSSGFSGFGLCNDLARGPNEFQVFLSYLSQSATGVLTRRYTSWNNRWDDVPRITITTSANHPYIQMLPETNCTYAYLTFGDQTVGTVPRVFVWDLQNASQTSWLQLGKNTGFMFGDSHPFTVARSPTTSDLYLSVANSLGFVYWLNTTADAWQTASSKVATGGSVNTLQLIYNATGTLFAMFHGVSDSSGGGGTLTSYSGSPGNGSFTYVNLGTDKPGKIQSPDTASNELITIARNGTNLVFGYTANSPALVYIMRYSDTSGTFVNVGPTRNVTSEGSLSFGVAANQQTDELFVVYRTTALPQKVRSKRYDISTGEWSFLGNLDFGCSSMNAGPKVMVGPKGVPTVGLDCYSTPEVYYYGCPSGYYGTNATGCSACPAGTFSTGLGPLVDSCLPCPAGTYSSNTSSSGCQACPPGTYSSTVGANSSSVCLACPAEFCNQVWGATSSSSCSLCNCTAGSYGNGTGCALCPAGKFQPSSNQSSCLLCPRGTYSNSTGVSTSNCTLCPRGKYSSQYGSTFCSACAANYYAADLGMGSCIACPAGSFSNVTGGNSSSTCQTCNSGYILDNITYICTACPTGKWTNSSFPLSCRDCPAGTFKNVSAGFQGMADCVRCPAGTYSVAVAANSSTVCSQCLPGEYQSIEGATSCSACPPDTYNPDSGAKSLSSCLACAGSSSGSSTCSSKPSSTRSHAVDQAGAIPAPLLAFFVLLAVFVVVAVVATVVFVVRNRRAKLSSPNSSAAVTGDGAMEMVGLDDKKEPLGIVPTQDYVA